MTDFSAKAPVNPEKPNYLHDQDEMPKAPQVSKVVLMRRFAILGLGALLTIAITALGVQLLDGWDARRNPLVPAAANIAAIGGICAAYLIVTRRMGEAWPGLLLVVLGAALLFFDFLREEIAGGAEFVGWAFTIVAAILLIIAMVYFVVMWLQSELRETSSSLPDEA